MKLEEYKAQMVEELKRLDWQNPGDKKSGAYRLLSRAAIDRELETGEWIELHEMYRNEVKRQ